MANIIREIAPSRSISDDYVRHVCRNSLFLRVIRIRSFAQEYNSETANAAELGTINLLQCALKRVPNMRAARNIADALSDPESNLPWYLVLRAVDRFYAVHGRLPGWTNEQVLPDVPLLKVNRSLSLESARVPKRLILIFLILLSCDALLQAQVEGLLKELKLDPSVVSDAIIHETCRFGGSELHNIAAFMGGVGSQEAIKVITCQWLPTNNAFVYNGINSTTTSFEL